MTALEGKKYRSGILFCTPCYGGMVHAQHFGSCLNLKEALVNAGIDHDWLLAWNESMVHRARMNMTAAYLNTDWSHMMWIDSDIQFEPGDVARLWNMDADVAVGVYPMKRADRCEYAAWHGGKLITDLSTFNGPITVDYAGTGFMLISRKVIEHLAEALPSFEGVNGRTPALYMTPIHNDTLESEDYHFCRMAREAGFKVEMDPTVKLKHWGQFAYGANQT